MEYIIKKLSRRYLIGFLAIATFFVVIQLIDIGLVYSDEFESLVDLILLGVNLFTLSLAGLWFLRDSASQMNKELAQSQAAAEEFRAKQQLFEMALNSVAIPIFIKTSDGNYTFVNQCTEERVKVARQQFIGKNDADLFPKERADWFRATDRQLLTTGAPVQLEEMVQEADGIHYYLTIKAPVRDSEGKPSAIIGFSTDITSRKRAENALRENQILIERITQTMPDLVYIYDIPSGNRVYTNGANLLGYSLEEADAMGKHLLVTLLHPDDLQKLPERLSLYNMASDGKMFEHEQRLKHKDGAWRWLYVRETIFARNPDGSVRQILGVAQDITERKQIDEALRQSQRFIERVTTTLPNTLYVFDLAERRTIYTNRPITELLGFSQAEIETMGDSAFSLLIHPEDLPQAQERLAQYNLLQDGENIEAQYRMKHKDGSWHWINTRNTIFLRDAHGVPCQILGISTDITARKSAEEALRESEQLYRDLFEGVDDAIFVHDEEANILEVNEAACRRLGYTREELRRMKITDIEEPEYAAGFKSRIERQLREGKLSDIDGIYLTKDGRQIFIDVNSHKVNYKGKVAVLSVARDVTQRQRAAEAMRESEERFRELFAASQRQAQELILLEQVRMAFVSELDLPVLIRVVVDAIAQTFGYHLVSLYLLEDDNLMLQYQVGYEKVVERFPITQGVSGRVVRTGEALLIEDVRHDPDFIGAIPGILSEVCVPLFDQGSVIGVLNIESQHTHFSQADLRLMNLLSQQIDAAISRARLFATLRQQAHYLSALHETALGLVARLDLTYLLEDILERAAALFGTSHGYIALVKNNPDEIETTVAIGFFEGYNKLTARRGEGIGGKVWASGQAIAMPDYHRWEERLPDAPPNLKASATVPLSSGDQVVGVLALARDETGHPFTQDDVGILIRFADLASVALENARLYNLLQEELKERLRMEDLLAYERTLLRTLIDTLQQPIFIKDTQSRYVLSNLAYAHLVGETPETILNHTDADYFPSDLALLYNTDDQAVMRTGQAKLNYEEPVVDVQGRSLWFAFSKTPLYDREGKIVGIVGAGFDITDRKRIQEAEREQRALAEAFRDTAAALSSTLDYEKVLDLVLAGIPRVVPAEAASIALVEAGGVRFVRQYGRDEASFSVLSLAPTPIEKIANLHTMYHTRQPLIIYDVHHYDGWVQLKDFSEVHSHLGCPILLEESVIGFINLYNHEPNFFTPEHAERLQSFANQAAVAIQNARQYQHAHEVAMVAERQRLARELHDAVSQTLFSASIIAETLPRLWERNPDDVLVGLKELQRLTRGALAEMRNLLLELRPRAVLETDMSTLLRHLADAVTGHTQVPVKLEIVGQGLLPEEAQLAFYRVAQEALNNTIKHARAKEIGVKFVNQPDQIDLMIHDNGRGFDPKKPLTEQFGLKIMQERAEAIGAQLFIQSQPGVGTAIRLTWLQEKD